MDQTIKTILPLLFLFFASSCTPAQPVPISDPTLVPSSTTAPTIPGPTETPAPIPTLAPPPAAVITELPSVSPTPETMVVPAQKTETPNQVSLPPGSRPRIIPIENTNCHIRPGKDPNIVGYFLKGMELEVFGKDPTGEWVMIPNPNRDGEFCWVWTGSTHITGSLDSVLVIP